MIIQNDSKDQYLKILVSVKLKNKRNSICANLFVYILKRNINHSIPDVN